MNIKRPIQWFLSLLLLVGMVVNGLVFHRNLLTPSEGPSTITVAVDEYGEESPDGGLAERLLEVSPPEAALSLGVRSVGYFVVERRSPYEARLRVLSRPSGWQLPLRI